MLVTLIASVALLHAFQLQVAPLDTMIDVGGHRLHFVVHRGNIPLTIVLESGGAATLEGWRGLDRELARRTGATVVAYDRAGFGRSELGPADLKPAQQVQHLGTGLQRLGVPARRIVVGASYGGVLAVMHADSFKEQTAGLVLVDPMSARFVDATGDFVYSTVPHITNPQNDGERAVARLVATFDDAVKVARTAEPHLAAPIVVITASRSIWNREQEDRAWRASHEAIAAAAPGRRLVVAENSGHQIAADRPDTIIDAVRSLIPANLR